MQQSQSELEKVIEKFIKPSYSDHLKKYIRPSVRLITTPKKVETTGCTKFGGAPDLPAMIVWPKSKFDHNPYSFLAQINLAEIENFDKKHELPTSGMIYLFFNFDVWEDGIVLFMNDIEHLKPAKIPHQLTFQKKRTFFQRLFLSKPQEKVLPEFSINLSTEYSCPSWDSFFIEKIELENRKSMRSSDIFKNDDNDDFFSYLDDNKSIHRLLGHYDAIQHGYIESELIDAKFDFENPNLSSINQALQWRLLFQFDSDENMKLNIIDGGKIYFFIHEEDLKKKDFSKVKIATQFF